MVKVVSMGLDLELAFEQPPTSRSATREFAFAGGMGVGGETGGAWPPWILKISAKKVVFLVSSGRKQTSPLLAPYKIFGKIP